MVEMEFLCGGWEIFPIKTSREGDGAGRRRERKREEREEKGLSRPMENGNFKGQRKKE